jgi:hypothetical protein
VLDNPDLVVACVVGDGEAETGPPATAWHSNKLLDPATDGAVLPILHLNGYKIANPTVLARVTREELEQLLRGYGWTSIRPARVLVLAVVGTQLVATLIAVYGLFMMPLGWGWALFVWGYALAWFLVNDRVKLLAYRVCDPTAEPLLATTPLDVTPQLTRRAYALHVREGRRDGHAVEDRLRAERQVRKDESLK